MPSICPIKGRNDEERDRSADASLPERAAHNKQRYSAHERRKVSAARLLTAPEPGWVLCRVLSVTTLENSSAPPKNEKQILVSASPYESNSYISRNKTAETAVANLTCLFRTRCFPFQYLSI